MAKTWVNGRQSDVISVHDRGFQFGDGLFETMRIVAGEPEDIDAHLARMHTGAKRLRIPFPDKWQAEIHKACGTHTEGVLKLILTRGESGMGLRLSENEKPTRIVKVSPLPTHIEQWQRDGVRVQLCQTRLSYNSATAGLKLLNWLEPALAYLELDEDADEGLMCNANGEIIEGTVSNFFAWREGVLLTPDLSTGGLAGITRAKVLAAAKAHGVEVQEVPITETDLPHFEACFISNSVVGLCPVRQIAKQEYPLLQLDFRL